jgi:hypothetical protein
MKKTLCILGVVLTLGAVPAFASPSDDSARGPVGTFIQRIVRATKQLLHLAPQDELQVPRP